MDWLPSNNDTVKQKLEWTSLICKNIHELRWSGREKYIFHFPEKMLLLLVYTAIVGFYSFLKKILNTWQLTTNTDGQKRNALKAFHLQYEEGRINLQI